MPERITPEARVTIADYVTVPDIVKETGASNATVHTWLKYHRYMPFQRFFGKPVVHKDEYARFKRDHPELIKSQPAEPAAQ